LLHNSTTAIQYTESPALIIIKTKQ